MSMLSWHLVACPVCQEPIGKKCRTLQTKRITDSHTLRMDAAWELRRRQRDR